MSHPTPPNSLIDGRMKPAPVCDKGHMLVCLFCAMERDHAATSHEPLAMTLDESYRPPFILSEKEQCAILRQLFSNPISRDGTSGPIVHELLDRLKVYLGPETYAEFVGSDWPNRLK